MIELSRVKSVNIMGLVRAINSTYIEVNRNLKILEKEDIITEQRVGRKRIIKLNRENQKTMLLLKALKILTQQTLTNSSTELSSSNSRLQITALM